MSSLLRALSQLKQNKRITKINRDYEIRFIFKECVFFFGISIVVLFYFDSNLGFNKVE
jgi:hypothetical protein